MPMHARARAGQRAELPRCANILAPFFMFAVALFVVYQVNHHRQLDVMITRQHELDQTHHFVTGGRTHREQSSARSVNPGSAPTAGSLHTGLALGRAGGGHAAASTLAQQHDTSAEPAPATKPAADTCRTKEHAEYPGDVVMRGDTHLVDSARACCAACQAHQRDGCNVWVFCGGPRCSETHLRGECWLKRASLDAVMAAKGQGHEGITWVSGFLHGDEEVAAHERRAGELAEIDAVRLKTLKEERFDLPLVWMDVSIKGGPPRRMEFVLFTDISPLAAECMRRLCTGEAGPNLTLKGATFYRIIDRFIDQTGINASPSCLGGTFKDDAAGLELKHDRKGLLSVANAGRNTNTGHFSILMAPAPHLNGNYVIFGELVSGWEVAEAINALSWGQPNNQLVGSRDAVIADVGQARRGKPVSDDVIMAGLVGRSTQQ